ncbi:Type cbb3 cytochrome oxidase biogenesis protein CcoI; Copper-translocating P-type ATPase, partial [hydrothermal vent metagenome]
GLVGRGIVGGGFGGFFPRCPKGRITPPPPPPNKDIDFFDYDEVQSQYVTDLSDRREITLMSDAIHCAACVWLIEHSMAKVEGTLLATVNFTNKRIKIRWDNRKLKLSDIIKKLNRIGYDATPYDASASEEASRKANRDLLYRLGFAGFAMMNVTWFSVALYTGASDDQEFKVYFYWLQLIIATATILYSGSPFFKGAWASLKAKTVGMDVSIALGLLTTYFYSLWVMVDASGDGYVYFNTLIDFIFLLLIGRYLEAISKNKALDSTRRLMDLQPKVARQLIDKEEHIVPVRRLVKGDQLLVKPGEQFPVDGVIVFGESMVNESMLTGESHDVAKQVDDRVSAGTLNVDGTLTVLVEKILQETQLGHIVHMVEEAQGSKPPIQSVTDKIMPWFVSATLSLSLASFVYWYLNADLEFAVMTATAVLIITCPCAFGLATPMAVAVATGVSARNGILVKSGTVLETLQSIEHFVFDKTGTLTKGKMKLVDYAFLPEQDDKQLLIEIASIERLSEHSLGQAISKNIQEILMVSAKGLKEVEGFKALSGKGVRGRCDGADFYIGTAKWLAELEIVPPESLLTLAIERAKRAQTAIWVAKKNKLVGVLFLEDEIRPEAAELIQRLKDKGKQVTLLSGDLQVVADCVAQPARRYERDCRSVA